MEDEMLEHVRVTSSKITGDGDRDTLESDLSGINGVRDVDVDPDSHIVEVTYDPTEVDLNQIRETIESDGYSIESETVGAR